MAIVKNCRICREICHTPAGICENCNKIIQENIIAGLREEVGEDIFLEIKSEVEEELKRNPPKKEKEIKYGIKGGQDV